MCMCTPCHNDVMTGLSVQMFLIYKESFAESWAVAWKYGLVLARLAILVRRIYWDILRSILAPAFPPQD